MPKTRGEIKSDKLDAKVQEVLNSQFDKLQEIYNDCAVDSYYSDREQVIIPCIRAAMDRWCREWQDNR